MHGAKAVNIARLRTIKEAAEAKLIAARLKLSEAQSAHAKARKEERATLLAYVEAMEASHGQQ